MHETRTAVVVMKAKAGKPEEVLRYAGVELRHEPAPRRLVLHTTHSVSPEGASAF